jgi:thiamine kinase-like enzyme
MADVLIPDIRISRTISSFIEKEGFAPVDRLELAYIPLAGGMSKATIYRFDLHQRSYVLKLLPPQSSQPDRLHQILLAQEAGRIGIGPEVHFVDPQFEAVIMDFIPGRTVHPIDFENNDQIVKIAAFLRQLHQSSGRFPPARSPFQRFHDFLGKGEDKKLAYPSLRAEAKNCMEQVEALLQLHPVSYTPTHLDLNSLNIMLSHDRFFLVDWVNGGMSDPYFDLAIFAVFLGLEEAQTEIFLTHYFAHAPTPFEWSRFAILKPVRLFAIAAAFLSQLPDDRLDKEEDALLFSDFILLHAEGKADGPLEKIGMAMLKAGLDLIDGEEFKTALKNLQELATEKCRDTFHMKSAPLK